MPWNILAVNDERFGLVDNHFCYPGHHLGVRCYWCCNDIGMGNRLFFEIDHGYEIPRIRYQRLSRVHRNHAQEFWDDSRDCQEMQEKL